MLKKKRKKSNLFHIKLCIKNRLIHASDRNHFVDGVNSVSEITGNGTGVAQGSDLSI